MSSFLVQCAQKNFPLNAASPLRVAVLRPLGSEKNHPQTHNPESVLTQSLGKQLLSTSTLEKKKSLQSVVYIYTQIFLWSQKQSEGFFSLGFGEAKLKLGSVQAYLKSMFLFGQNVSLEG